MVPRSKLEKYVDILTVLAHREPLNLTHIMDKTNTDRNVLKRYLEFLIQQDLVEEQILSKNRVFYAITERGLKVLNVVVPIIKEARKIPALLY